MPAIVKLVEEHKGSKLVPDDRKLVAFSVTVSTLDEDGGGTDANVYIEVAGHSYLMDKSDYNDFERGDTDVYSFRFPDFNFTLGRLRASRIRLHHDNADGDPGWRCGQVVMQVQAQGDGAMWVYKIWPDVGWLAKDEGPFYTTEAILQDGTPV